MDFKLVQRSDGRKEGIILYWKKEVNIQLLFSDPNYIDVKIVESDKQRRFTGIYEEFQWERKHLTWQRMRNLKANSDLPWLMMGDFNEILYLHEKEGGAPRPQQYMNAFRDALLDCELEDMGFIGDMFTWRRGMIRERLDRAVANQQFTDLMPNAAVTNMEFSRSDHRPVLLDTEHYRMPDHMSNAGAKR
jgi:hypothetical protein